MAVTIHQTPAAFTPSDNPIVWVFSSDQTAQANFSYLVQVYVNDVLASEETIFPQSGADAIYDASNHASNNCNIPTIGQDLLQDAENYCELRITVFERYGSPPTNQASAAASNIVAWKARMTDDDFIDWDPTNYIYGAPADWLTNYPGTPKVKAQDEDIRLMLINDETNITNFSVELFEADGTSIVSDTTNFTATSFQLLICNVSPENVVSNMAITQNQFNQAAYYVVSAAGMNDYRIDIDDSCTFSTYKRLHFLSQWGDIGSYSFGLISRRSGTIQSYGYQKSFGEFGTNSYTFSKAEGQLIDHAKYIKRKMTVTSDWLSESVQNYLALNLLGSPVVYVELLVEDDITLQRRRITNAAFDEKIGENDTLFLMVAEIDLTPITSMIV